MKEKLNEDGGTFYSNLGPSPSNTWYFSKYFVDGWRANFEGTNHSYIHRAFEKSQKIVLFIKSRLFTDRNELFIAPHLLTTWVGG